MINTPCSVQLEMKTKHMSFALIYYIFNNCVVTKIIICMGKCIFAHSIGDRFRIIFCGGGSGGMVYKLVIGVYWY